MAQCPSGSLHDDEFCYAISEKYATITGYTGKAENLEIPSRINGTPVLHIGNESFYKNKHIKTVTIPEGVASIGSKAFYRCRRLSAIALPGSLSSIGSYAFYGCRSLNGIDIPDSLKIIDDYAFMRCSRLTDLKIGNGTSTIGTGAFQNCARLESVSMGYAVERIGAMVFFKCKALSKIFIPCGAESIGSNACEGCKRLMSISIPASIKTIGSRAFSNCKSMERAFFSGDAPRVGDDVFFKTAKNFTVCHSPEANGFLDHPWSDYNAQACEFSQPPSLGEPFIVGTWTALSSDPRIPCVVFNNTSVLWTYAQPSLTCQEPLVHKLLFRPAGTLSWTVVEPLSSGDTGTVWIEQFARITGTGLFELKYSATNCEGQTACSEMYYVCIEGDTIDITRPPYNAAGDGVTNDRPAIIRALEVAAARFLDGEEKTEIFFPAGDYALLNDAVPTAPAGISYYLPNGFSGLTIRGAGINQSRILWTDGASPNSEQNRLQPDSYPMAISLKPAATDPEGEDRLPADGERLSLITFTDISIWDDNPVGHQRNPPTGEETHGFSVAYADHVTFKNVGVYNIGDEGLISAHCSQVLYENIIGENWLYTANPYLPAIIDIMHDCNDILIEDCTIFQNSPTGGVGIQIEAQGDGDISNILIRNNIIGGLRAPVVIHTGAAYFETKTHDISITDNTFGNSTYRGKAGIQKTSASNTIHDISIMGNHIRNMTVGIELLSGVYTEMNNFIISDNTIEDIRFTSGLTGIGILIRGSGLSISDNVIDNCDSSAVLFCNAADVEISGGVFSNLNRATTTFAGIGRWWGSVLERVHIDGITLINGRGTGINGADVMTVENSIIDMDMARPAKAASGVQQLINNTLNAPIGLSSGASYHINGNDFILQVDPGEALIPLVGNEDTDIINNRFDYCCTGSPSYAITMRAQDGRKCSRIRITGNNFHNTVLPSGRAPINIQAYDAISGIVIENNILPTGVENAANTIAVPDGATLPQSNTLWVQGSPGGSATSDILAIDNAFAIGDICTYIGMNDSRPITIKNGANTSIGEDRILKSHDELSVRWDGFQWVEHF